MDEEVGSGGEDLTALPMLMDAQFEKLDTDAALRPTTLKVGDSWMRTSQEGLLSKAVTKHHDKAAMKSEKAKAFDLLDALTRSGDVEIGAASFHVVLAATHCFARTVMNECVVDNTNVIAKMERSALIVASTIHATPAHCLVKAADAPRVEGAFSPEAL